MDSLNLAFICLYNFAILAGTSYLVFYKGISPWWFILAICCLKADDK